MEEIQNRILTDFEVTCFCLRLSLQKMCLRQTFMMWYHDSFDADVAIISRNIEQPSLCLPE